MKVKYLLLIPMLLSLFCGGDTLRIAATKSRPTELPAAGLGAYKIILHQQQEQRLGPLELEVEEAWLPVLDGREMTASKYFVYDLDREAFLILHGQESDRLYPASTTKLFTAYVALRYINADQTITVGAERNLVDPESSIAGLEQGDVVTAEELVAAMMLPSGNDATYSLTTAVGRILKNDPDLPAREAVKAFVNMMNIQAKLVGLQDSHFVTPDGFHEDGHYISLGDMVTIAKLAIADPVISAYMGCAEMTLELDGGRQLTMKNTNLLLHAESEYYCTLAKGLKTGYTEEAGNCLLTLCRLGQRQLLIGTFGCPEDTDRFGETLLLLTQAAQVQIPGAQVIPVMLSDE